MDKETFRQFGHKMVDWIADYIEESVEDYEVKSPVSPGEIKTQLPASPPQKGEYMEDIWEDFQNIIMPGITHWQHPGWFAYFPSNNSPASILGELLSAGLGVQGMVWATSPAAEELEEVVVDWLRQMLGLPKDFRGVIQDTASTATLSALLTAREKVTEFHANYDGVPGNLRVYASGQTHSSIEKGMRLAGYGSQNMVYIETDEKFALKPQKLREAINKDRKEGKKPACVIATIGTTSSTAIDPLAEIGRICQEEDIWLHVDAAFAGTAAVLKEKQDFLDGAEYADSFVFNPHKWMGVNFDCSAYFVKDPGALIKTMTINPEYLKTAHDNEVNNYRNWGIQLGRRFRALKLWFVLRDYGIEGIQEMVRFHITLAKEFKEWIANSNEFELLAPVHINLVCFRWNDGNCEDAELNEVNRRLLEKVNNSGRVYLTHTELNGSFTLRLVAGQRTTRKSHVEQAWKIIQEAAEKIKRQR